MTATIIAMPVAARIDASGADEVVLHVRLPRILFNRMARVTETWNIGPTAAAECLLMQKINEATGIKSGVKR